MMKQLRLTLWLIISLMMSACGGGGGGSGVLTSTPTTSNFSYSDPALQSMFMALTALRNSAIAGEVIQKTQLDIAAKRHADYLVNNNLASNGAYIYTLQENGQWGGHYESRANAGFTGATPQARADAAGYDGTVNEIAVFGAKSTADCVASIDNSTYHLVHALSPFVDMGINFNAGNGGESVCIVMLGVTAGNPGQFAPVEQYVRYPANKQTNLSTTFYNQAESPNPAPDLPLAGRPVLFSFYNMSNKVLAAKDVVLHAFTMEDPLGNQVSLRILTFPGVQSDGLVLVPDSNIGAPGFVVALPTLPLKPETLYKMTLKATVMGKLLNQQWTFATGLSN